MTFVEGQRVRVVGSLPMSQRLHAKSFETSRRVGTVKKMSTCGQFVLVSTEGSPKGAWWPVASVQPYTAKHQPELAMETRAS